VSSPLGFSPPGSPPYDPTCFPYEEMTGRILLGSSSATLQGESSPCSSLTPSPSSTLALTASKSAEPPSTSPQGGLLDPSSAGSKTPGKETKTANIASLIKSKTADFEKLAGASSKPSATTPASSVASNPNQPSSNIIKGKNNGTNNSSAVESGSIAPKMRLRSQDNIVLKQQFLLRQQSHEANKASPGPTKSASSTSVSSTTGDGRKHRPVTRRRPTGTVVDGSSVGVAKSTAGPTGGLSKSSSVPHHPAAPGGAPGTSRWKRSDIVSSPSNSGTPTPTASPGPGQEQSGSGP